jgi:myo-inositol-1(or 4)-monophosphatase
MREEGLTSMLETADRAASEGARIVVSRFGQPGALGESKGRTGDWVTEVDRRSEAAIRSVLERATPDVPILGEEEGGSAGERYWVVDPLDGTTNFLLGFPVVAISIALVQAGRPVVAVVRAPLLDLAFSAIRGTGAWSGGDPLRVSEREPGRAVVATALPFRDRTLLPRYMPVLETVFARVEDIRRPGAAALDLSWVAAGVFDGYFELNLSPWDVAAGALLVEESGGVVTDWEGGSTYMSGDVLAGSPRTHPVLLEAATRAGQLR